MPHPWKRNIAEVHVRTLAHEHGVSIRWLKGRRWYHDSEASEVARLVHIPHPRNARQYLVALHELGHVLGSIGYLSRLDLPDTTPGCFHLICEAAAWAWAMEHIHPDLDRAILQSDADATIGKGLTSHCWALAEHATHG